MPSTARERLAGLLAAQDEMSSSVQLRAMAPADLQLEVEGIGRIAFPVSPAQARRLRGLGNPARFGQGEETLTDSTIRDTWQIPTEKVQVEWLGGPGLDPELESVREELGLPDECRLTAELHSMLIYEKGQFFLPHQDSEKDDAMVATLVVTLPSAHTGGELVVHHLGEATTYRGSKSFVSLVAFYADCRHEVRPVTSGHRITLTYNLFLHGDPAGRVPDEATVGELARHLDEHFTTPVRHPYRDTVGDPPRRLAFLLDHEYTAHSLSWPLLKGADAHRAALLRAGADAAGGEAVLALTEINEIWDAEDPDSDDRHGRYGRYSRADRYQEETEEDEDDDDSRYQLNDIIDSSIRLTLWTNPEGTSAEDVSLTLADAEVFAVTPSSDLQPSSSEYEGYMGNYGNTLDRWYHRAAVVVWPRNLSFANRAEASPSWALDDLSAQANDGDPAVARTSAATLAPFWEAAVRTREQPGQLLTRALSAAVGVDDADVAAMLLRPFTIEHLSRDHMTSLAELNGCYGEEWTDELLSAWFGGRAAQLSVRGISRPQWIASLPTLCDALLAEGSVGTSTARRLLEPAWTSLSTLINSAMTTRSPAERQRQLESLGEPLAALIRAAGASQATDLRTRIVEYCLQYGEALTLCLVTALRAAAAVPDRKGLGDAFVRLAADQTTRLRARLAVSARAEDDWSIELPSGCACELCGTLRSFLADPTGRTLEWRLAQERRSHVHSRIQQAELPVTHLTRRQGSPYTLVLTKTAQLFQKEAHQRLRDQADADWLVEHWASATPSQP